MKEDKDKEKDKDKDKGEFTTIMGLRPEHNKFNVQPWGKSEVVRLAYKTLHKLSISSILIWNILLNCFIFDEISSKNIIADISESIFVSSSSVNTPKDEFDQTFKMSENFDTGWIDFLNIWCSRMSRIIVRNTEDLAVFLLICTWRTPFKLLCNTWSTENC